MARGPLIPGLREYDAPRHRRSPVFWMWTVGAVVAVAGADTKAGMKSTVLVNLAGRDDEITEFVPIFHAV